jgi:hypothetical protein
MPRVSVVITTYNRSALLQRAIESARNAGTQLELIVVDDCSTDDTPDVCARIDDIRYVRLSTNRGLSNARNVGIEESSSEFITFLDDDDLRLPGSIDKQLRIIESDDEIALCYGQAFIADAHRQLPTGELYPPSCPQGDIFWDLLEHNLIPVPTALARKSSLLAVGGFNIDLKATEDWDMWLRLSERFSIAAVTEPVAIYRKATAESGQMCSNSGLLCRQGLLVQQMALGRPRARASARKRRRDVRRKFRDRAYAVLMSEAMNALHEGKPGSARANFFDAFRFNPLRTVGNGLQWLLLGPR